MAWSPQAEASTTQMVEKPFFSYKVGEKDLSFSEGWVRQITITKSWTGSASLSFQLCSDNTAPVANHVISESTSDHEDINVMWSYSELQQLMPHLKQKTDSLADPLALGEWIYEWTQMQLSFFFFFFSSLCRLLILFLYCVATTAVVLHKCSSSFILIYFNA